MNRFLFLAACLLPNYVFAASDDGNFAAKGIGQIECRAFIEDIDERSEMYWSLRGWIDGYVTGYNVYVDETFDITPFSLRPPSQVLLVLISRHCEKNPDVRSGVVLKSVLEDLHFTRTSRVSGVIEVRANGTVYPLYEETLIRIQRVLASEGHYDGEIDGMFGAATQAAISAFQKEEGIPESGAPTPFTVLRLLVRLDQNQ